MPKRKANRSRSKMSKSINWKKPLAPLWMMLLLAWLNSPTPSTWAKNNWRGSSKRTRGWHRSILSVRWSCSQRAIWCCPKKWCPLPKQAWRLVLRKPRTFRNFSPKGLGSSLPIFYSNSLLTKQARNLLKYAYHSESELKSLLSNPPTLNSVIFCWAFLRSGNFL